MPRATRDGYEYGRLADDLRPDMTAFTVPTLILHGAQDVNVAPATTSRQAARMIPGARYVEYEGSGHAIIITDAERVNRDLLSFVRAI